MRLHFSGINPIHQHAHAAHHNARVPHHEHHWIEQHTNAVALTMALILGGLLIILVASIQFYILTGIWPFSG